MQTWLVHMRSPRKLISDLGWRGYIVIQLLVGGTVLAALVHPLFLFKLLHELTITAISSEPIIWTIALHLAVLAGGYLASIALGAVGLYRRGLLGYAGVLAAVPIYWILLSIAAWRALFQLMRDPYRWEKTEHGLANSSRLAQRSDSATSSRLNRG